ncbi:DUF2867 domain-containing protein [Thioalkalivibrio sp. XN8]|uniref:DUF2867 domain-containing protein n=1 Tax=Thioalkalivibrio sp. XN8 TaxID=2712863 RepID=UPI0013EAD6F6|nr:DUF2867 domain-containing protein [Thioalkalivibrio sp. XN8]NGP51961.1 SDR family oxidoreductase [Thioalkalivibrio sp. XN8]
MNDRRVAVVLGASGYMGSNLAPALAAAGWQVRAVARNKAVLEAREWPGVECWSADVLKPETLAPVLEGADVVYYLVHMMWTGSDFVPVERRAAENARKACEAAGVRRIVYLGGIMPKEKRSQHMEGRRVVGDTLREGSIQVIELQAAMIVGPGSAAFEVIRDLVNHLPFMITPKWVRRRSTPIALENVLTYTIAAADLPFEGHRTLEIAGPDVLTYQEIMNIYGEFVGKKPIVLPVPVLTPKLSSYWLYFVTSVPPTTAMSLVEGLAHDYVAEDHEMRELVPQRLLTFRESIAATLEAEKNRQAPARWVEGSIACRDWNPKYSFYAKKFCGEKETTASREALFEVLQQFGRDGDFFSYRPLWWLRRAFDWLIGGPSFRTGRRDPETLRMGDIVDGWRVLGLKPNERLTLSMLMRAPGSGLQEFNIRERDGKRMVELCSYWHPAGFWGLLYWYGHLPLYSPLVNGAVAEIARRAEALERASL